MTSRISRLNQAIGASGSTATVAGGSTLPQFDQRQWDDELGKVDISKYDLNALVFDYLLIEGFSDAAVEFARETGLPAEVDHEKISERMEIREAVEDGRVEEAVRRVNELDPEILDTNPPLLFHLHLLRLIELIRKDDVESALEFATNELAPRGAQNPEFLPDFERVMGLLAFPDLARFADDSTSPLIESKDGEVGKSIPDSSTIDLFKDPAFQPIISLMRKSQRVKVAKQLNAAILESQGHGMETKLNGLVRLMSWGEEKLSSAGIGLPLEEKEKGRTWARDVLRGEMGF